MNIDYTNPWTLFLAILTAVLGVGRLVRVITYDDFPPTIWARMTWDRLTNDGPWAKLAHCFWCATPWIMLVAMVWGWFALGTDWAWTCWAFWGWMALSYVSSMIVARDEPA